MAFPRVRKADSCMLCKSGSHFVQVLAIHVPDMSVCTLQVGVLIVGAGPTGLGAATRIHQHGLKDWLLIDKVGSCKQSIMLPSIASRTAGLVNCTYQDGAIPSVWRGVLRST